jgi:hypothetical protein
MCYSGYHKTIFVWCTPTHVFQRYSNPMKTSDPRDRYLINILLYRRWNNLLINSEYISTDKTLHHILDFCKSLSRSWHTDLDYESYRLSNVEIGLTAGVTDQQGMLTPPWHLIPPLICTPILWFVFPIGLMRLITDRYFCHFILDFCFQKLLFWHVTYCAPLQNGGNRWPSIIIM